MIFSLVRRDLKGRYKGSILGFFWTFLNPLLQLCVYTVVFSLILRSDIEQYYLHLFVALVPWLFFSVCLTGGSSCIRSQQDMVKKIYFPREVLPIAHCTSQFVNMCLSFLVVFVVVAFSGRGLHLVPLLYMPLIMAVEYLICLGTELIVSALTVYVRDLEYLSGIISMAWQFLTPIMYPVTLVPDRLMPIFMINPMTPIIVAYRDILYFGQVPKMTTMIHCLVYGIVLVVAGFKIFGRLKRGFAEEL